MKIFQRQIFPSAVVLAVFGFLLMCIVSIAVPITVYAVDNIDGCSEGSDPKFGLQGQDCVPDSQALDDDNCPNGQDPYTFSSGDIGCLDDGDERLNDYSTATATNPSQCQAQGGTWTGGGVDVCTFPDGTTTADPDSDGSGAGGGGGPGTPSTGSDGADPAQGGGDDDVTPAEGAPLEADCVGTELNGGNCGIIKWITIFINALTTVFGIIAVIMIAVGGVQYSFSRDNPQQTAAAKERIRNVIIAIVAYVFLYGFIQYIIPGGIL